MKGFVSSWLFYAHAEGERGEKRGEKEWLVVGACEYVCLPFPRASAHVRMHVCKLHTICACASVHVCVLVHMLTSLCASLWLPLVARALTCVHAFIGVAKGVPLAFNGMARQIQLTQWPVGHSLETSWLWTRSCHLR